MKNKFKRRMSGVLAFLMCIMTLFSMGATPVHAATQTSEGYMVSYPRDGDSGADRGTGTWGHTPKSLMNGWNVNAMEVFTAHAQDSYTGKVCYCIEPGVARHVGDTYSGFGESFWDNYPDKYNKTIEPATIKTLLGRIMQYGYQGDISLNWKSQNSSDREKLGHIMATQVLIWETVVGERDSSFNHVSTGGKDTVKSMIGKGNPCYDEFIEHYNSIVSSVKSHTVIPSFMANSSSKADEFELEWNGSEYTVTLTDKNDVLSKYSFSSNVTGMTFNKSGNKLTITTKDAPKDSVKITATKDQQRKGVLVWSDTKYGPDGGVQDVVTYSASVSDPVKAYVNVKVSYGSAKIVKTSEDDKVEGIKFTIAGEGINQTVTTNSKGEFQIDNLAPGTYTITEQTYDKYEPQEVRRVTVVAGQTSTVNFNNVLKRGDLTVTKTSEDGMNEGVKFRLFGTSISGLSVDEYAVTDANGVATFEEILIGTGYTLEEVDTAIRYVVPECRPAK